MTGIGKLKTAAYAAHLEGRDEDEATLMDLVAQIERETLPRPLFEDGEPVQFGDRISIKGCNETARGFKFYRSGPLFVSIVGRDHEKWVRIEEGERLKRPEPPDSWERVEADVDCGKATAADVMRRCKALAGAE